MRFEWLSDPETIHQAWQAFHPQYPSLSDPYILPDVLMWNQWIEQGQAGVIAGYPKSERSAAFWFPFVLRPLPNAFYELGLEKTLHDIISPYGFAGPLYDREHPEILNGFFAFWTEFCKQHQVVAEFVRFNPLLENQHHCDPFYEVINVKDVVYFDLTVSEEELLTRLHPQKRRYFKKSEQQGLTLSQSWQYFPDFIQLYQHSMTDKQADPFYCFSENLFKQIEAEKDQGHCWLHSVVYESRVISSALFLSDGQTVQYFLGASNNTGKQLKSSAWLLWQTALIAKEYAAKRYVLGGGLSKDDSLFQFKRQLSSLTAPYCIGRKIHHPTAYQKITATVKQHWPAVSEAYTDPAPLFFYRAIPQDWQ